MATGTLSTNTDFYVYALFRENGVPFYVGKGKGRRWTDHDAAARKGTKGHKNAIIRDMHARGAELIKTKIHEGLTESIAHEYEVALIKAIGRGKNGPLTNLTEGGEGTSGFKHPPGRKFSSEHKAKLSAARVGKKLSPEQIMKMSLRMIGRKASQETREKMSATRAGKKPTPEAIAKSAASRLGGKMSPEARAKMSAARRANKIMMEHIASLGTKQRGKKLSSETRAKISATGRGRKQSPEHVAKRAAAHIGKTRSEASRKRMSDAQRALELMRAQNRMKF